MRILQINAVYKTMSTGRIAMEMHHYFQSMGHESYVAYAIHNTDTSKDPHIFRVGNLLDHKLHAVAYRLDHMQGCHSRLATKKFLNQIRALRPDVVLTHNLHANYLDVPFLLLELKKMNIKVVMDLHDCWLFTGGCYHYTASGCSGWLHGCKSCDSLGKAAAKKYRILCEVMQQVHPTIVATSKWIEGEARKSLLSARCDIHMIYDWIDATSFYPREKENIRRKYDIGNRFMILGVATGWAPDKGQNEMIEAAKAFPDARVVLVGHQAVNREYPPNVILIPFTESKDELAELYSAADVFFNPSRQETFGLVSGEALACGTPIVVYNTTACPEFVTGNTGVIMHSSEDMIPALQEIRKRNEHIGREQISLECQNYVAENFNLKTNIQKYLDLFDSITK